MKLRKLMPKFFQISLLVIIVVSLTSGSLVLNGKASPASAYYYRFRVDREGFTNVEINFSSTDASGSSWVFVPKVSSWNYTVIRGQFVGQPEVVETDQVPGGGIRQYFYKAFKFSYQASGFFNMTLRFDFDDGALIIEPRGIFYSPLIGFQSSSVGTAEVDFYSSFTVKSGLATVIGVHGNYPATQVESHRVLFSLPENIARVQVEFDAGASSPQITTLKSSDNKTFTFNSVTRYQTYAKSVLRFYDRIYKNFTGLFNVTLDNVVVQWFLPDFDTLLVVGGFVPITAGERLGEININVAFIRGVNGTIEVIAAHELVHRFLGKAGVSPNAFLWLHEGMAQYVSVSIVLDLNYEDAQEERDNLENGAAGLIQQLGNENFSQIDLQNWNASYQPPNVDLGSLYVASYYVVSRLPVIVQRQGFDYYGRFFKSINGVEINDINLLSLYLSTAANASVALTLQRWGFTLTDLFKSPVGDLLVEAGKAVGGVNPVFQPYRSFAEYFYEQGLLSAEQGDWEKARSLLQLSITMANLAPWLTFLTIIAILALVGYILHRRSRRPKPTVPPLPPEILQPAA